MRFITTLSLAITFVFVSTAAAQSSSLLRPRHLTQPQQAAAGLRSGSNDDASRFDAAPPRDEANVSIRTLKLEKVSLFAIHRIKPRKYKPEDLITIIVRQQKKYEADAEYEARKKWDIGGELSKWFRFYDPGCRLGEDKLSNGNPGFEFKFNNKYKTEGENEREDTFKTRITSKVIDIKPNGNLVLEATMTEQHDDEVIKMTLTGICRSEDVTADNTILSTQIANLNIVEKNQGAVRDATSRGWIPRILDFLKPF